MRWPSILLQLHDFQLIILTAFFELKSSKLRDSTSPTPLASISELLLWWISPLYQCKLPFLSWILSASGFQELYRSRHGHSRERIFSVFSFKAFSIGFYLHLIWIFFSYKLNIQVSPKWRPSVIFRLLQKSILSLAPFPDFETNILAYAYLPYEIFWHNTRF